MALYWELFENNSGTQVSNDGTDCIAEQYIFDAPAAGGKQSRDLKVRDDTKSLSSGF